MERPATRRRPTGVSHRRGQRRWIDLVLSERPTQSAARRKSVRPDTDRTVRPELSLGARGVGECWTRVEWLFRWVCPGISSPLCGHGSSLFLSAIERMGARQVRCRDSIL